ncbi:MAG TPA: sugar transferase, partial [Acidimicrobiales bacterium]|nr:sugar transferase [Acidimicrobiales bacterium]
MGRLPRLLLFTLSAVVVAALGLLHARVIAPTPYSFTGTFRFPWLVVYVLLIWMTTYGAGLPDQTRGRDDAAIRSLAAVSAAAVLVSLVALVVGSLLLPRFVLFGSIGLITPISMILAALSRGSQKRHEEAERVIAVASPADIDLLRRDLSVAPERAAGIVAVLAPEAAVMGADGSKPLLVSAKATRATLVVLSREAQADDGIVAQVAELHASGVRVRTLSLFYDEWLGKLPISELERMSLMFDINEIHQQAYSQLKRAVDVGLAAAGLLALVVLVPVVGLLDIFGNRGSIFYRQQRVGKGGEVFTILKFRTMRPSEAPTTWTGEDDPRIGRVGHLLRKTHLDEVPQVINVLRRDLSIVGPRPEQPRYVSELSEAIPYYDVRHLVRPGMTGWAQVKYPYGASEMDAIEKLQYE